MRVLVVTTWLPTPSSPSTGAFVVKDVQALRSLGHEVVVVHLLPGHQGEPDPGGEVAGAPVVTVPMTTTRPDQVAAAGRRVQSLASSADLLHTMAFSSLLPTVGWRPGVPWVHTEHWSGLTAPQTLPRAWRLVLPTLTPLLRSPDVVTAVCGYLAAPIRRERRGRAVRVVPCVVRPPDRLVERPDGPGTDGVLRLVGVGALVERKDPVLAVDTVAELASRGVRARLTLVGEGPLRSAVQHRADERGVAGQVILTGPLDRAGVLAELARADLFLGPTRGENFFVSCAEALVSGRPVVVGATGGQGEYIAADVGRTVPRQDPRVYADAVQDVLRRAEGLTAADIAATVGDRFSPEAVAAGYAAAYRDAEQVHGAHGAEAGQ